MKIKRINGWSYKTEDGSWEICHEGSNRCWYAVQIDDDGYTDEWSKQYFTTYADAKTFVLSQVSK